MLGSRRMRRPGPAAAEKWKVWRMGEQPSSEEIYRGKLVTLKIQTLAQPIGGTRRFEIVEHPDAVAIVALRADPNGGAEPLVALVRQPRPAIGQETWEIPAGIVPPQERDDPLATAARELLEETGYVANEWQMLSREYPSPGFSTEAITIYLATALRRAEQMPIAAADPAYAEISEVVWQPLGEAQRLADTGEITDGKTLLGLYLTRARLTDAASATGGETMPRDFINMPRSRLAPFRAGEEAPRPEAGGLDPTLKIENMLLEEYSYASSTAYQAMEDRARMFNLYLLLIGVVGSAVGAIYQLQSHGVASPEATRLVSIMLCFGGALGVMFFNMLLKLRQAYRESLVAMNEVKEYYIAKFEQRLPDIGRAFRWRMRTIPGLGHVTFIVCATAATLASACFAAATFTGYGFALAPWIAPAVPGPDGVKPVVLASFIFALSLICHLAYYIWAVRKDKRDRKSLAEKLSAPPTESPSAGAR
jgi:ADP-ribose pyrophosphatase